jgi:hypothetical protein
MRHIRLTLDDLASAQAELERAVALARVEHLVVSREASGVEHLQAHVRLGHLAAADGNVYRVSRRARSDTSAWNTYIWTAISLTLSDEPTAEQLLGGLSRLRLLLLLLGLRLLLLLLGLLLLSFGLLLLLFGLRLLLLLLGLLLLSFGLLLLLLGLLLGLRLLLLLLGLRLLLLLLGLLLLSLGSLAADLRFLILSLLSLGRGQGELALLPLGQHKQPIARNKLTDTELYLSNATLRMASSSSSVISTALAWMKSPLSSLSPLKSSSSSSSSSSKSSSSSSPSSASPNISSTSISSSVTINTKTTQGYKTHRRSSPPQEGGIQSDEDPHHQES